MIILDQCIHMCSENRISTAINNTVNEQFKVTLDILLFPTMIVNNVNIYNQRFYCFWSHVNDVVACV